MQPKPRLAAFVLLLLGMQAGAVSAQPTSTTIRPGSVVAKYWGAPVAEAAALPGSGNRIGDVHLDLDLLVLWAWNGVSWDPLMLTGPQGDPGAPGAAGVDGKTVRNGTGVPSSGLGVNGDFYIDTTARLVYGPKASGSWGSGVSFVGPPGNDGAPGSPGAAGTNGATWLTGAGVPSSGSGANGDLYFRTNGDVYLKSAGAWSVIASLAGPPGQNGNDGVAGPAGQDGQPQAFQDEGGADLTVRPKVNCVGSGIACTDDSGGNRTTIGVAAVTNASVSVSAAIDESKLALNNPTHSNANDPSAGQKAALAGTSGTPGSGNPYVTDADARNTNARTPTAHAATHQPGGSDAMAVDASAATGSLRTIGTGALQAAAGNDSRLSDARTPLSHVHAASDTTSGVFAVARLPVFVASGSSHAAGLVPDPGASAGTVKYLREDATFVNPLTGFTASKCARFDGSGNLVAASGDCSAGDTTGSGVGGSTGSVSTALLTANGTGGATLQAPSGPANALFNSTGLMQFGGTTSAYPALQYLGCCGVLSLRLADNSGDGILTYNIADARLNGGAVKARATGSSMGFQISADSQFFFGNTADILSSSMDAGLARLTEGVLKITDGTASGLGWQQWAGTCTVASDQTNASATLQIAACFNSGSTAVAIKSGRTYSFACELFLSDSVAVDGAQIDFGAGTATASNFRAQATAFDTSLNLSAQLTSLTGIASAATFTGAGAFEVHGSIAASANGTFQPRFAQAAHTTGTLTLRQGSNCVLHDVTP